MNFYKLSMAAVMLAAGSVCVAAETATEYEKIGFLCSDGIGLNGVNPGWNSGSPYVVSKSDDGMFRFSVRFGQGVQTWMMFTDGVDPVNADLQGASARVPDLKTAFENVPEDLMDGSAFRSKYLMEIIGKPVNVNVQNNGGFQVTGNGQAVIYNIVMPADLSTMTIESVSYPENLYLYGDATSGGWEVQSATAMKNLGNGIYWYVGELKAGSPGALQFYAENPSVSGVDRRAIGLENKVDITSSGVSETGFNYYETGRPGNCYYQVQETGNYIVKVDVRNNIVNVYNNLYFVGESTGWQFVQMEKVDNGVYTYKGHFDSGKAFCFTMKQQDWDNKIATGQDVEFGLAEFTDNTLMFGSQCAMKNGPAGYYVVSADLNNMTLTTRTYNPDPIDHLYVACNGAYNEMTEEGDGVYAWSGELNGGFTITTNEAEYPCYMAAEETVAVPETGLADSEMVYNTLADNGLNKWNNSNSGNYTVRVNTNAMTLSVQKGVTVGVNGIDSESAPVVYYDMMGRKVQNPANGIYVRVQGADSQKIVVKNVK